MILKCFTEQQYYLDYFNKRLGVFKFYSLVLFLFIFAVKFKSINENLKISFKRDFSMLCSVIDVQ